MLVIYGLIVFLVISLITCLLLLSKRKYENVILRQEMTSLSELRENLEKELDEVFQEKSLLQERCERLILDNGKFESKIESLEENNSKMDLENREFEKKISSLTQKLHETQTHLELKIQAINEMQKRMDDWEKSRSEAINHAKAAIFEAGSKLSNQLIEKHKSETKESAEKLTKTQKELQGQFESIINNVAVLNNEIKSSKETVDHVKRALLTPSGAGSLAEITLENILKASGLEHQRDYIMQYSMHTKSDMNKSYRPDAVVFLPGDNMMIIDSKASKFFTELGGDNDDNTEKEINVRLKNSMRNHLKSLSSKDYQDSLREHLQGHKINHVSSIMFLPSEIAVEKISKIDQEFVHKAWEKDIFPVGPSGLINILTHAKFQISANKQAENHQKIVDEVRKLLHSFSTIYEHARKVGSSLYSATNNFDKFAASFNANIIPKAKNLNNLGVNLQSNKKIPSHLERFTIVSSNKVEMIEVGENKIQELEVDNENEK